MNFSKAVSKFGWEAPFMVFKISDKSFVVGKFQIGGNLLHIFFGVAKKCLGSLAEKAIDQRACSDSEIFLTNSAQMIRGISKPFSDLDNRQGRVCVNTDPFKDFFGSGIGIWLILSREEAENGKNVQQDRVYQIVGYRGQMAEMEELLEKSGVIKLFKEPFGKGKGSVKNRKMKPIKAYVGAMAASPMANVGGKQKYLPFFNTVLLAILTQKYSSSGYINNFVGWFCPFGVDPRSLVLKESCVTKVYVGVN